LYSSPNIIRQINSRRMRWAGHLARRGEARSVKGFGGKAGRKETIFKTEPWIGGWDQNGSWGDWLGDVE
jgi:hypothetical protein